jgi:predicted nucleotidyltransferase
MTDNMHTYAAIKESLASRLEGEDRVLAAWEGGSAATGYFDEYSDLDLMIVIKDKDTESIFQILQDHLESKYGILRMFRVPEPAWHGMSQCFYLVKNCSEFFYLDIAVIPSENQRKFTEPDRHGHALVWFDKEGIYQPKETPNRERDDLARRVFHAATDYDWIITAELGKALARDNWIASQMNYHAFVNRHLVPLMNIKYRPAKADFGIRYAEREFPKAVAAELGDLLKISSLDDIRKGKDRVTELFEALKTELEPDYN